MEGLPVMLWGLDPLYWIHVKLFVVEVLKLPRYPGFQGVYAITNHPIERAEVVGYVVKVDKRQKLTVYEVDDGTASIPCCHWVNQDEITDNIEQPKLGDLVTVLGKITTFQEQRQITIKTICIEKDPNTEILHWLEVLKNKEIYNKPFKVPDMHTPEVRKDEKFWLKTDLDVEIDKLEEVLKKEIADYLDSTNYLSFSTDNLCTITRLKEKAMELSNKYDERLTDKERQERRGKETSEETRKVIRQALRKLEKEGIVFCKHMFNDGYFEFISVKSVLSPRILRIMQDLSESEGESSYGVSRSKIQTKLKSLEKYKNVRGDKVTLALNHLLLSGEIYETKDYHYRRV